MAKKELEYNMVKGIFERMFFSSISGASPLSAEEYHSFSSLTTKQVMTMQDLAILCKKYEDSYNKSSSKFHWSLNHARQYRDLRDDFVKRLQLFKKNIAETNTSSSLTNNNDKKRVDSPEKTALSLQSDHINSLRSCSTKKNSCKWIHRGETIEINGQLLTKGLFYIGDYFKIPQSYRQNSRFDFTNRNSRDYNRGYKLLRIYGPVLHKDLPISQDDLHIISFSCYSDMHPTHRYEYVKWLAGEKDISEISLETFLFYIFGLKLRMFIDESTTEHDRIEIINNSIELYFQCQKKSTICQELVSFIDAAISKYFTKRLEELVPKALLPHLELSRDALIFNAFRENKGKPTEEILYLISHSIVSILNHDDIIPEGLINDNFYRQYIHLVWQDLGKRMIDVKSIGKESRYEVYCMGVNNNYSKFFYDYIFSFILIPKSRDARFVYYSFAACFKDVSKQLKDVNLLYPVSPVLALFILPPLLSISECNAVSFHMDFLREKTKNRDFTTISVNEILCHNGTSQKEPQKISKKQFALIINSLGKIGYDIVPNALIGEELLAFGNTCVIYQKGNQDINEQIDDLGTFLPIIKVAAFLMDIGATDSEIKIVDDFIKLNVRSEALATHLMAYLRWRIFTPELNPNDYKNIKKIGPYIKDALSAFFVRLICSNGRFTSHKQEKLAKILSLINVAPQVMHSLIHRISTEEEFAIIENVNDAEEFAINKKQKAYNQSITLSNEFLEKIERQTKQAQTILSDIFTDNEETTNSSSNYNAIIEILKTLLTKESWTRNEVDAICKKYNFMIGFALEQINDYSYSIIEDAVIEDDGDTIYVMTNYKDKLI